MSEVSMNSTKKEVVDQETANALTAFDWQIAKNVIHIFLTVLFYMAVVVMISQIGKQAYDFAYQIFGDVAMDSHSGRDVEMIVTEQEGLRDIAADLKKKGLIKDEKSFYLRSKLSINEKRPIVPGTYVLNTSQNYEEILNILTNTEEVEE